VSSDERHARAVLSAVIDPGDPVAGRFVGLHGAPHLLESLRAALAGSAAAPGQAEAPADAWARYLPRLRDLDPAALLDTAQRAGARFVCPGELEWPSQLEDLGDARPLGLWVRGERHLRTAALRSVAVVGARACSSYGSYVAAEFAAALAEREWTIVSGAAFGIDAAAHRGALAVGGLTVAVLACGVDVSYPAAHHALLGQIARDGVLLTEHPPGARPRRHAFIRRNRLLAALSRGTVVVEAAPRSGSLSTARSAAELGRQVMGVPGPVTAVSSAGVHRLIRDGCGVLVATPAEVIELVGRIGVDLAPPRDAHRRPVDELDRTAALVLDAVPARRGASLRTIARDAGVAQPAASRALEELRHQGWITQGPDGWQINRDAPGRMLDVPRRCDHVG
jgi:DNA processing protein